MISHIAMRGWLSRCKRSAALKFIRRSLLAQLLGVYLVFVLLVIGSGLEADAVGQSQIRDGFQSTDLTLAQEVSFDTYSTLDTIKTSLVELGQTAATYVTSGRDMSDMFSVYEIARPDIDRVYWLDTTGALRLSVPSELYAQNANFASSAVFRQAASTNDPIVEGGSIDPTTNNDVVTIAESVRDNRGAFLGVLATTLLLDGLSTPLRTVIDAQTTQGQHLVISVLDDRGELIASPDSAHLLQPLANTLPGAASALAGNSVTSESFDSGGEDWLYTALPVPALGWAVVVQRPAAEISQATANFRIWLLLATGLFALGGLLFWTVLLRRVVRPLHVLTDEHSQLPPVGSVQDSALSGLTARADEIGKLSRSLQALRHDVAVQLSELRTLLETSNAVVNSLDPRAVGTTIIREVRRLVDVQAAAVLVPDKEGTLRVLVSEGRAEGFGDLVHVRPDNMTVPSARAFHERRPVQVINNGDVEFPSIAASEGFKAILAIPIITQRVGGVVLVVHRREPQPFSANEVDLLLTFANHATLAWEHAVLYERSDERLHEIARENERLYRQAMAEKQTLAAIMGSMTDGLLLTSADGVVVYANPGARALLGMPDVALGTMHISAVHTALAALAEKPEEYRRSVARAEVGEIGDWLLDVRQRHIARAMQLRLFDVHGDDGEAIGRGLLLRDVTRERELDQFKSTLLAAVGHELRTPLAAIKGHASTLLQDDVSWSLDDQRHFLGTISTEADRLALLVTNLLDLSRHEAGLLALHRTAHHLDGIVEDAVHRLSPPPVRLSVDIPNDLPLVRVDAARIQVVVQNLIANANAYGDGTVHVSASRDGEYVRIAVSNDGPRIAEDDLPHIFERFYRADRTRNQNGGTGLGLAICKAFVEAHGGAIWAESESSGTVIAFTLPATRETSTPVDEPESPSAVALPETRSSR